MMSIHWLISTLESRGVFFIWADDPYFQKIVESIDGEGVADAAEEQKAT